jgi:hypothetical protein
MIKASLRRLIGSAARQHHSREAFHLSTIIMELDDINGGLASQEMTEKKRLEEIERADELDMGKYGGVETIDHAAEKRLVRKLDFWYDTNSSR